MLEADALNQIIAGIEAVAARFDALAERRLLVNIFALQELDSSFADALRRDHSAATVAFHALCVGAAAARESASGPDAALDALSTALETLGASFDGFDAETHAAFDRALAPLDASLLDPGSCDIAGLLLAAAREVYGAEIEAMLDI